MLLLIIFFSCLKADGSVNDLYAEQEAALSSQKQNLLSSSAPAGTEIATSNVESALVSAPPAAPVDQSVEKVLSKSEAVNPVKDPSVAKLNDDSLEKLKAERDALAAALKKIEEKQVSPPEKKLLGVDFDYDSLSREEKIGLITASAGIAFVVLSIISFKLISYFAQRGESVLIKSINFNSALKDSVRMFNEGSFYEFDSTTQALRKQIEKTIKLLDKTEVYASTLDPKQAQLLTVEILTSAQKSFSDQLTLAKKGPYSELAKRVESLTKPSMLNLAQKRTTKNSGKNIVKISSMSKKTGTVKRPQTRVFDDDAEEQSVRDYSSDEEDVVRSGRQSRISKVLGRLFHD